jgi:ribose/xylose/arabinose/galactoside ABC-type transport system permease subunit
MTSLTFRGDRKTLLSSPALAGWANNIGLIISLVALIVLFSSLSDVFFQWNNALNIGRASAYTGIAAAITTLVLVSGALDLSIGAVMALVGVVAARLLSDGHSLVFVLVACLAVGAVIGLVNGVIVTFVGVNPFIVTIGTQFVARGLAYAFSVVQGGELVITRKHFLFIGQKDVLGVPFSVWLLVVSLVVVAWVMSRTKFGRHLYAIGGSAPASRLAGIPLERRRMQTYVLSGVGSALAGIVLASYTGAGIAYAATGVELTVIASVILGGTALMGGRGTIFGTFLGILILGIINNGLVLLGLGNQWQLMVTGGILLLAVVVDEVRAKLAAR